MAQMVIETKIHNPSNSTPSKVETAASTQPPHSHTAATSKLATPLHTLPKNTPVDAKVNSSELLDKPALQLLVKANPTLANQLTLTKQQGLGNVLESSTPALYLVKLTSQQQVLTSVTSLALKAGDQVQLQLQQVGTKSPQLVIQLARYNTRTAIADALRQALPQQQTTSQLINTLSQLKSLPSATQQLLLSSTNLKSLNVLSNFSLAVDNKVSPADLKDTLSNSGIFLESKLRAQKPIQNDLRTLLSQLQQSLSTTNNTHQDYRLTSQKPIEQLLTQLLQTPLSQTPAVARPTADPKQAIASSLLQLLGIKVSAHSTNNLQKTRGVISQQLQKMINGIQEKILLNQLRSLSLDTSSMEINGHKTPQMHSEIPLRWGEQVLPLQVSIREHYDDHSQDKPSEEATKKTNSTRRWQVFLAFDLPNGEKLYSQLTVINDAVSATLWTESHSLCEQAKQQLSRLRKSLANSGLTVSDLSCIEGKPPSQELSLNYNLVDITT